MAKYSVYDGKYEDAVAKLVAELYFGMKQAGLGLRYSINYRPDESLPAVSFAVRKNKRIVAAVKCVDGWNMKGRDITVLQDEVFNAYKDMFGEDCICLLCTKMSEVSRCVARMEAWCRKVEPGKYSGCELPEIDTSKASVYDFE